MRAGHWREILQRKCLPIRQRFRLKDMKIHFVAGDRIAQRADDFTARFRRREHPQALPDRSRRWDQKNLSLTQADSAPVLELGDGFFCGFDWEHRGICGLAKASDWACRAVRLARTTDRRPQVHQRGGVAATTFFWKKGSGRLMEKFFPGSCGDVFVKIKKPGDDALDIGVQYRNRLVECECRNCRRRVGPDSRQREEEVEVVRNAAAELRENRLGSAMEIPSAGVVSKTFPVFHDILLRCGREGCDIRKSLHPSLKIRLHGGDGRLLEHEFGNQNGIRGWITPPRQDSTVGAKPFLECLVEIGCSIF